MDVDELAVLELRWVKHSTSYCLYVYTCLNHNVTCFCEVFRHITNAAHLTCILPLLYLWQQAASAVSILVRYSYTLDCFLLHCCFSEVVIVIYRGYELELLVRCTLLSVCARVCVSLELHPSALLTQTTGWQTHLSSSLRIVKKKIKKIWIWFGTCG